MENSQTIPVFKPLIEDEEIKAATESLRLGWLGMGKYVGDFEEALKSMSLHLVQVMRHSTWV